MPLFSLMQNVGFLMTGLKLVFYCQMKYSVDEPTVSTSFKEKVEEKNGTDDTEKDEIIAKLKGKLIHSDGIILNVEQKLTKIYSIEYLWSTIFFSLHCYYLEKLLFYNL